MHITDLGLVMVCLGLLFIVYDLFRVYQFQITKNWTPARAIIVSVAAAGFFFRLLTFEYLVGSRRYKCSQTLVRDSWVEGLTAGSVIQARVCPDKSESAVIDHQQIFEYIALAGLNSLWIIVGWYLIRTC